MYNTTPKYIEKSYLKKFIEDDLIRKLKALEDVDKSLDFESEQNGYLRIITPRKYKEHPSTIEENNNFEEPAFEDVPLKMNSRKKKKKKKESCVDGDDNSSTRSGQEKLTSRKDIVLENILEEPVTDKSNIMFLTNSEKKKLEEITRFTARPRCPDDERQIRYYNKHSQQFKEQFLPTNHDRPDFHSTQIANHLQEDPGNILSTESDAMLDYLLNLKDLIAAREIAWAEAAEHEFTYQAEIERLKTEVKHLRVVNNNKEKEINEKKQQIIEKSRELENVRKIAQKLRLKLIQLENYGNLKQNFSSNEVGAHTPERPASPIFYEGPNANGRFNEGPYISEDSLDENSN